MNSSKQLHLYVVDIYLFINNLTLLVTVILTGVALLFNRPWQPQTRSWTNNNYGPINVYFRKKLLFPLHTFIICHYICFPCFYLIYFSSQLHFLHYLFITLFFPLFFIHSICSMNEGAASSVSDVDGRAIAQAVSRWLPTAAARVQTRV
jgi:hypothetical protein